LKVILTHDNTDFDALASMLAAAKLYPGATPVLPSRLNRNLRDFLTLYWDELPFVETDDLPKQLTVDEVILVDTQAVPTFRGVRKGVPVRIIDHHPLGETPPPEVSYAGEPTGATTTLLVEQLSQQHARLSAIEATLLLLGIYEDTGSLSYPGTTTRDLRAVLWLMENGGSLDVVDEFLRYPLTEQQRELYDQLMRNLETVHTAGQSIIVATARVDNYVEEISTVAHKLRDLYDPDALFLLVDLGAHIQLVARSTTSAIDVGDIATFFNGGGHSRASAALIRGKSLAEVHGELLEILGARIKPLVTVSQIMSYGAHTLREDATVSQAGDMMRRYGHEGFPVVNDSGQIVGILTRREIDRALHHHLGGALIRLYMHPGDIHVSPEDSVERLQQVMMDRGLGQVPVVENGQIVGIVTRTDLIKLWSEPPRRSQAGRVVRLMEGSFPKPLLHLLHEIGVEARAMGSSVYLVGGVVRDLLLGLGNLDLDLVIEGDAITLANRMGERLGGRVRSHSRFGTAKWLVPDAYAQDLSNGIPGSIDFVTARTEFYEHPTALPTVERSSIRQDLHRRDFTINTLAICLDPDRFGELLDYFGGERDLAHGLIRVLHSLSFVEDPTRVLRAVRLEQRLKFHIEPQTAELIDNALELLDRVSGERIRHELYLIFKEDDPAGAFRRLDDLRILTQIHPALRCDDWFVRKLRFLKMHLAQWEHKGWAQSSLPNASEESGAVHTLPDEIPADDVSLLYLSLFTYRMIGEELETVIGRLRIAKTDADRLREVHALRSLTARLAREQRASNLCSMLRPYSSLALFILWVATDSETVRGQLELYHRELQYVRSEIAGEYLKKEMHIPPGPLYGRLLTAVRDARLDGEVGSIEEERALVERLRAAELAGEPALDEHR
jgi:tRNA nucleotidyltransferase (CCA-adding enzyme)